MEKVKSSMDVLEMIQALFLCVIMIVNFTGNISLWIVILRSRALRSITSMFILGLSSADLLVASVNMPLTVYTIIVGHWSFSDSACVVIGFINMFTLVLSVMSLCNISINRFFMVCRPSKFKDVYTTRNAVLMILATVVCSILLSSPPLLGWSEYVYTSTHSFCFADWVHQRSYAYFMICCCFGIPFSVMTVCNVFIIRSVRASKRKVVSNYITRISSTISSVYNQEVHNSESKTDKQDHLVNKTDTQDHLVNKTDTQDHLVNKTDKQDHLVNKTNNSNTLHPPTAIKQNIGAMQQKRQFENNNSIKGNVNFMESFERKTSNIDVISNNISYHLNWQLLKSEERHDLQRNSLFSRESPRSEQSRSKLRAEKEIMRKSKQTNVDGNLLHPQWKSQTEERPPFQTNSVSVDSFNKTPVSIASKSGQISYTTEGKQNLSSNTSNMRRREEIRLAVSLIIVVVLFVISWLPYCLSMLLSIHYKGDVPKQFHMFTLLIGYANSGCNPIIYGVMNQRFKVGFKRLFCFWRTHRLSFGSHS